MLCGMEQLAEAFIGMAAVLGVFGSPTVMVAFFLSHRRQMKELDIRQIEAQTKLAKAQGMVDLPEYIDSDDPLAVSAYRRAKEETLRSSAKHAAASRQGKQV
jgi:hypothetical protein